MTNSKKEINVACNYLLRLIKAHVELSAEQIQQFKRVFFDTLSKRFVGHWFPATPHRGSAFRCLQTKHWKDPVLRTIAERSSLPLHRYLPTIFTMWIDPGEVAICFGDDGTWCSLYATDMDGGDLHQDYSDGEETVSSLSSDEDLQNLTQNVQTLTINHHPAKSVPHVDSDHSRSSSSLASRSSSPYFHPTDPQLHSQPSGTDLNNLQPFSFWPSTWTTPDSWLLYHQEEKPFC